LGYGIHGYTVTAPDNAQQKSPQPINRKRGWSGMPKPDKRNKTRAITN